MKAFKVFNRDMKCRDFQYEEGQTYTHEGDIRLCTTGFHFCKDLVLTLQYYPCAKITDNRYAEVEILGKIEFEIPTEHKGVTDKIKIIRVLSDEEVLGMIDGGNNSGIDNSGLYNSGISNSGLYNSGKGNSGSYNSGDNNSGSCNSGNRNSGNLNSGNGNPGLNNSGNRNSGNLNSGNGNSGSCNSGNRNSGNLNSGDGNSGSWNSGNRNSGFFNIDTASVEVFGKTCLISVWEEAYMPRFLQFNLLEGRTYKQSFKKSWDDADPKDRVKVKDLPNFDAVIFYEISGIDLRGE